jgi:hypothetical protein
MLVDLYYDAVDFHYTIWCWHSTIYPISTIRNLANFSKSCFSSLICWKNTVAFCWALLLRYEWPFLVRNAGALQHTNLYQFGSEGWNAWFDCVGDDFLVNAVLSVRINFCRVEVTPFSCAWKNVRVFQGSLIFSYDSLSTSIRGSSGQSRQAWSISCMNLLGLQSTGSPHRYREWL